MNITIKHFQHTGHSNWVLIDEHGDFVYRTRLDDSHSPPMKCGTRKVAEELALGYADEMDFETIKTEYFYGVKRKYKTIK